MQRYIIILNEKAGTEAKDPEEVSPAALRETLAAAGVTAEVQILSADAIKQALEVAVAARPDAVVIGGGDGTVRCAAAVLAGSGVPLGVLPLGTLNHFAKDLKIPTDLKAAVATLTEGVRYAVDVGEVNGHVFINNCSLGAYAEAVRRRDALRAAGPLGKWRAMGRASWETFRRLRLLRLRLTVAGDEPRLLRTPLLLVGNNRYTGHLLNQSLRPRLDEGRLWLYTVHAHRHLAVLRLLLRSLVGRLDDAAALRSEAAEEIVIESEGDRVAAAADGEVLELRNPLHFRVRPGALQVIIPREGTDDRDQRTDDRSPRSPDPQG